MTESLSPFVDEPAAAEAEASITEDTLTLLEELATSAKAIKAQIKKLETQHEQLREQATAAMREAGLGRHGAKVEAANGRKIRFKVTESGWMYSEALQLAQKELKLREELERTRGTAKATKQTATVDFS